MYYGIIMGAVLLFGVSFFFNERYEKKEGGSLLSIMRFSLVSALSGVLVLVLINGFSFARMTGFTLLMALCNSLNGLLYTFCSLKALERINLSLYSVFSMLGGMALPFVGGLLFFEESLTLAKLACFAIICAALALTFKKSSSRGGFLFYVGIFVLNGVSGILSTFYQKSALPKGTAADYSILSAAFTVLISLLVLLLLWILHAKEKRKETRPRLSSVLFATGHGSINRIANWMLILSLGHVHASAQYPMVTGGVMIVSTALAFFTGKKPSRRELLAVGLSFVAILALIVIPI